MGAYSNPPWLGPSAPLKPIASPEALDAAETPLAPEPVKEEVKEEVKEKPKAKPAQKQVKKKIVKDAGKAKKEAEGTKETPEEKALREKLERKAKMLADISRRMSEVMDEARQGGSAPVFTPIRDWGPKVMTGDDKMMTPGRHGSSKVPLQATMRWGCDRKMADKICNYNRKEAEPSGYFGATTFLSESQAEFEQDGEVKFFDSNTGNLLFTAPRGRKYQDFAVETEKHGWPSFRDDEVNWKLVRVLPDGETISTNGTHLGHNLPDMNGNRYCINAVSIAGTPVAQKSRK